MEIRHCSGFRIIFVDRENEALVDPSGYIWYTVDPQQSEQPL